MVRIIRHNILPNWQAEGTGAGGELAVTILVVSYNTRDMTMACLASVIAETRALPYEIIVVDNASDDGSAEAIATLGDRVRLLALRENIGFARANNLAAREARGHLLLLLNPDTVVLDGAIDRLAGFANANPAAGIWGGRTLFGDKRLDPTSVWAKMTPWSLACRAFGLDVALPNSALFNAEGLGGWDRDSIARVDIVCGCLMMIRRELWETLGGFDRAFFMYGEEADLCLRAAKLGARPLFTPTATIIHYGGASERTQAGKVEKLFRAKVTLMRRHWSFRSRVLGQGLLLTWAATRLLAASATGRASQTSMWREVWQRREMWLAGWDETGDEPSAAPATNPPSSRHPDEGRDDGMGGEDCADHSLDATEITAARAENLVRYSICTLMTSRAEYAEMLASFRAGGFVAPATEYLFIDNSSRNGFTAFDGLNRLLEAARGEVIVLCHQDLRLLEDGRAALDARLAALEARDPNWAVAGNAGGTGVGRLAMRISDPHGDDRRIGSLPERAMSLDENFIVLKRSARIGFSRDLSGFHFYGADLCLAADVMGFSSYVIDFHLRHLSDGRISPSFYAARKAFRAKWSRALRPRWMQTTCGLLRLTGSRFGQAFGAAIQKHALKLALRLPNARGWPNAQAKSSTP